MLGNLVIIGFILGVLVMIFWTPVSLARGVSLMESEDITKKEMIINCIPIINICRAESKYTGGISWITVSNIAFIVTLGLRIACAFTLPNVYILQIITIFLFIVSLVFFFGANMRLVWMILTDVDATELGAKIWMSIIFPIGQYYIGNFLPMIVKNLSKEEEVFK